MIKEEHKQEASENVIDDVINPDITSDRRKSFLSEQGTQITDDEAKEVINVEWKVYFHMFIKDWNWITYILTIPLFAVYSYFGIYSTYYSGIWIENSQNKSRFWEDFYYAVSFPFGYSISVVITVMLVSYSTIRKSRLIHEQMLTKIMNAPINTYFDKTPSGKILNRFSRDLNKLDSEIFR